jgi:hypothetical protein
MFNNLLKGKKKSEILNQSFSHPTQDYHNTPQTSNMLKVINNLKEEIVKYKKEIQGSLIRSKRGSQ